MDIQQNKPPNKRHKDITERIKSISDCKDRADQTKINLLFSHFAENGDNFNAINLSCLLNKLSGLIKKRSGDTRNQIAKIVDRIPGFESTFGNREIATILKALTKLDIRPNESPYHQAICSLLAVIPQQCHRFNPIDIANILNAVAKWDISLHESPYREAILALVTLIPEQASRYAHEKFWPSCPQNLFASRDLY